MTTRKQPSARELRTSTAGAELREKQGTRYVHGLAVVYDKEEEIFPQLFERIERGAVELRSPVHCYFNHDSAQVLATESSNPPLRLEETAAGLHYSCPLPDTSYAKDLEENLRRRNVTGSSFAFVVPPGGDTLTEDKDGNLYRTIHRLQLFEAGPVTMPAYSSTSATVRAHAQQLVEAWRSLGRVEPVDTKAKHYNGTAITPALRAQLDRIDDQARGLVPMDESLYAKARPRLHQRERKMAEMREKDLRARHRRLKP